jgi:acetyltransferase-like isoleucine patch superfamily enzyme
MTGPRLTIGDRVAIVTMALPYFTGTIAARYLGVHVGKGSRIHRSVRYWRPSRIRIGRHCEIREDTSLDARSLVDIGIEIGDECRIKDRVALVTYGGVIHIGHNVLIGRGCTLFGHGGISIGDHSMLSPGVTIVSSNHVARLTGKPFQDQGFTREAVSVGRNVWIGTGCIVLGGAQIRDDVVIGAGSVVRGDLPGGGLYAGNPAEKIRALRREPEDPSRVHLRNWGLL